MTKHRRDRIIALARVISDDFSEVLGVNPDGAWHDIAEAMAMVVLSRGNTERPAAIGAFVYLAAGLPEVPHLNGE